MSYLRPFQLCVAVLLLAAACSDSAESPCQDDGDCAGGVCDPSTMTCVDASCTDGVRNGTETDVDCGGTCAGCAEGEGCNGDGDCASGVCEGETCVASRCGNGVVDDPAEECDDGGQTATCDSDCTLPVCGDGDLNTDADEDCDDGGESPSCDSDCTAAECGDSTTNTSAGEVCDHGGNSFTCDADCTPVMCGDGFTNPLANEECDDGNTSNNDSCVDQCRNAECGDGYVNEGVEECDDANTSNNDLCTNACAAADCSDGYQNADEIDVDCGGHCGPGSCQLGQACEGEDDCGQGSCLGGTCQTELLVGAGTAHTCAILPTGTVRCWGANTFGQLGYGNVSNIGDDETPASAGEAGLSGSAAEIAGGTLHTCALLGSGAVQCWGNGEFGQLGYGDTLPVGNDELPAVAGIVNIGGMAIQVATGAYHSCALMASGAVRCWGDSSSGQLGLGNTDDIGDDELPTAVSAINLGGVATKIVAGGFHTCALLDTGAVTCWGRNTFGQLGYGNSDTIGDDEAPATAGTVPVGGTVVDLAAGWFHTCALLDGGAVRCWGDGSSGQLGRGNTDDVGDDELPSSVAAIDVGGPVQQLMAGIEHTCALRQSGDVTCWGNGEQGQLGYGNTDAVGDDEAPSAAGTVTLGGIVVSLARGLGYHTCAVLASNALHCWGNGADGQLGYGNTDDVGDDETPLSAGDVPYD